MTARSLWCVALGSLLVAASCSDSDDEAGYTPELRESFVEDCTDSGTEEPVCGCVYDALEAEVPFTRFAELDEELRGGTIAVPDDIQEMVVSCAVEAGT